MKCPACGCQLTRIRLSGVTLWACKGGCGGLWFERFALRRLHQALAGQPLPPIAEPPGRYAESSQQRYCPHCQGILMMRHYFSPKKEVELDECPGCAGIWLDAGKYEKLVPELDEQDPPQKQDNVIDISDFFKKTDGVSLWRYAHGEKTRRQSRQVGPIVVGIFCFLMAGTVFLGGTVLSGQPGGRYMTPPGTLAGTLLLLVLGLILVVWGFARRKQRKRAWEKRQSEMQAFFSQYLASLNDEKKRQEMEDLARFYSQEE